MTFLNQIILSAVCQKITVNGKLSTPTLYLRCGSITQLDRVINYSSPLTNSQLLFKPGTCHFSYNLEVWNQAKYIEQIFSKICAVCLKWKTAVVLMCYHFKSLFCRNILYKTTGTVLPVGSWADCRRCFIEGVWLAQLCSFIPKVWLMNR